MVSVPLFVLLLFAYAFLSQRIEQTPFTAPIVFTVAGMLLAPAWRHIAAAGVSSGVFLRVAVVGLRARIAE